MRTIDNIIATLAGLMVGSTITVAAKTASAEEATNNSRPLVESICEGQPDMPEYPRPHAGCQLWRDLQHSEDLLEFDSVNPLRPRECSTYHIVRDADRNILFDQSYERFEISRDRLDYARLGVLLQHYADVLGVEDYVDFADRVLEATRRDTTITPGTRTIHYSERTGLVLEIAGATGTAEDVDYSLNIPLNYFTAAAERAATEEISAEEDDGEDDSDDEEDDEELAAPFVVQPEQPAVQPPPSSDDSEIILPVTSESLEREIIRYLRRPVEEEVTLSPQSSTNRPRNHLGFGVPYLHVDGLNMAGAALDYVRRVRDSVVSGGFSITYVTDGVSGDSYEGPNSRTTEANSEDPFGTTSGVTELLQDTHHILTAGPRMEFDLTGWLSIAASLEFGIFLTETNGTVTEALYMPSGAELDSNSYDLEPVRHVNGIGLVRLGPHFGGRRAGAGIEGMVSLDFDGNVGGGVYAGMHVER